MLTLKPEVEAEFLRLRALADAFASQPLEDQTDEEFWRIIREANARAAERD